MTRLQPRESGRRPTVVMGAGPGIGAAVARRFGADGDPVVLIARHRSRLGDLVTGLRAEGVDAHGVPADATDAEQLRRALQSVAVEHGDPGTLCYSPLPRIDLIKPVQRTSAEDLIAAFALSVGGAAAAVQETLPAMLAAGDGRLLFTTGSGALSPTPDRAASAVATTAEAVYVALLASHLAGTGVTVAHLTIAGRVGPGALHEPDSVADALYVLATGTTPAAVIDGSTRSIRPTGRLEETIQ